MSAVNFIVLASTPKKPTDIPISDRMITSDDLLKVSFGSPDNGGSPIISYELVMDDGKSGSFISLVGFKQNSLLQEFSVSNPDLIVKGRRHRFMYRAKNIVGWGPYSDEAFVLAARVPSPAEAPYFLTFQADSLSIVVPRSLDNGGAAITSYELWVDEGTFASDFRQLTGYTSNSLVYTATEATDGLVKGTTYRFISRAINDIGASPWGVYGYIAFGDVPLAPNAPVKVSSSMTSIKVSWSAPAASDLAVTGYVLSMDDGQNTDLVPIYINKNRPDILQFEVGNLTAGLPYRF